MEHSETEIATTTAAYTRVMNALEWTESGRIPLTPSQVLDIMAALILDISRAAAVKPSEVFKELVLATANMMDHAERDTKS